MSWWCSKQWWLLTKDWRCRNTKMPYTEGEATATRCHTTKGMKIPQIPAVTGFTGNQGITCHGTLTTAQFQFPDFEEKILESKGCRSPTVTNKRWNDQHLCNCPVIDSDKKNNKKQNRAKVGKKCFWSQMSLMEAPLFHPVNKPNTLSGPGGFALDADWTFDSWFRVSLLRFDSSRQWCQFLQLLLTFLCPGLRFGTQIFNRKLQFAISLDSLFRQAVISSNLGTQENAFSLHFMSKYFLTVPFWNHNEKSLILVWKDCCEMMRAWTSWLLNGPL